VDEDRRRYAAGDVAELIVGSLGVFQRLVDQVDRGPSCG
jgi:hypothetical protein